MTTDLLPDAQGDFVTDSHCHQVREGDTIPCPEPPGEPHRDEEGDVHVTVLLATKENRDG